MRGEHKHCECLTGKQRYRLHHRLFRRPLVVLEVEVRVEVHEANPFVSRRAPLAVLFRWRDALAEDLMMNVRPASEVAS